MMKMEMKYFTSKKLYYAFKNKTIKGENFKF